MIFYGIFGLISTIVAAITFYIIVSDPSLKATNPYFGSVIAFVVTYLIVCLYSIPMLIAHYKKHPQLAAIIVLNIVAIITGITWIVALVWAFIKSNRTKPKEDK